MPPFPGRGKQKPFCNISLHSFLWDHKSDITYITSQILHIQREVGKASRKKPGEKPSKTLSSKHCFTLHGQGQTKISLTVVKKQKE